MSFAREIAKARGGYAFRLRYQTLRSLLDRNGSALELLADLEADLSHLHYSDARIRRPVERVLDETLLMAQELNLLTGERHTELYRVLLALRAEIDTVLRSTPALRERALQVPLDSEEALDPSLVGGKAAGVARLRQLFPGSVPPGFTITTTAYTLFLEENDLQERIRLLLGDLEAIADRGLFRSRTQTIRDWILGAAVPSPTVEAIRAQAAALAHAAPAGWAVRSSATSEDGICSFAGQFDTLLGVAPGELEDAYRAVLASRFADRAVTYRLHGGFREVETPMAVLFMPLIEARAAGVLSTFEPAPADVEPGRAQETMIVNAGPGLGAAVVRGTVHADTFQLSREDEPRLVAVDLASPTAGPPAMPDYLPEAALLDVGRLAFRATQALGHELDVEWALGADGKVWLLQGRRLTAASPEERRGRRHRPALPLVEGGITIFPGRAEGPVVFLPVEGDPGAVPRGAVVIVEQARPELAAALPRIAALLVEGGNPVGHLATLVREFSVPCLFRLGDAVRRLITQSVVSVDATGRKVYAGSRWPGIRDRVLARIQATARHPRSGPLYELVLALNLTDPDASAFRARGCRSIHDCLRFMHEMSVRSMFGFGDQQRRRFGRRSVRLKTRLPLRVHLVGLDGCLPAGRRAVEPEAVASLPFQALWRGLSDPRLAWPERWRSKFAGLPRDFQESVFGGVRGPRRPGDSNYAIVAGDYLNLNARFTYHYAMVDAIVGPGERNNHVHFRFRGGGTADEYRALRARFLQRVLRASNFGVERKGDLVTAWLRRYADEDSVRALEMLGRLLVCARNLDLLMRSEADARLFAERFLGGDFVIFS